MVMPSVTAPLGAEVMLVFVCACGKATRVTVKPHEYHARFVELREVDDSFPDMPDAEREVIATGTCAGCKGETP
jgi:hypothetical protein